MSQVHSSGLKVIGPTRASRAALAQAEPGSTGAESSGKAGSRTAQERLQVLQNVLDREGWALVVDVFRMFQVLPHHVQHVHASGMHGTCIAIICMLFQCSSL